MDVTSHLVPPPHHSKTVMKNFYIKLTFSSVCLPGGACAGCVGCGVGLSGWGVGHTPTVMGVDLKPPSPSFPKCPLDTVASNCSSSMKSSTSELLSSLAGGIRGAIPANGVRSEVSGLARCGEGFVCRREASLSLRRTFW